MSNQSQFQFKDQNHDLFFSENENDYSKGHPSHQNQKGVFGNNYNQCEDVEGISSLNSDYDDQ